MSIGRLQMNRIIRRWVVIASMGLGGIALSPLAIGQGDQPREFNVPPQALESALRQVASANNLQVLYDPKDVQGLNTSGVKGNMPPKQAVERLIEGTGLSATFGEKGSVVLKPVNGKRVEKTSMEATSPTGGQPQNPTLLAQAPSQSAGASETRANANEDEPRERRGRAAEKFEKIEVTGSRLRVSNESVPIRKYTIERIEESGKSSVAEFLNTLPEVSLASTQNRSSAIAGETTVRLRGFPAGATATLLNGRRLDVSGNSLTSFDLSALPLAIIERIDVLPSGSSAIYGSDAIAGVVNFITKRDLSGAYVSGNVSHADDYTKQEYSAAVGRTWDHGNISAIVTYEKNNALFGKSRDIVANQDFSRFADVGGRDVRSFLCFPGTVVSRSSANLPGLSATSAGLPPSATGSVPISAFVAGTRDKCSPGDRNALFPDTERFGAFVSGWVELARSIEGFGELLYSHVTNSVAVGSTSFSRVVPASNAFNPFGVSVQVQRRLPFTADNSNEKDYFRPLAGARGDFSASWHWEIAGWTSREVDRLTQYMQITSAINSALASSDSTTAFNPFVSAGFAPDAVINAMFPKVESKYKSYVNAADAGLYGNLFDLPSGPVRLAVGGEYQAQNLNLYQVNFGTTTYGTTDANRRVKAAYAEFRVPVLDGNRLNLIAAGHYDRYSDFGSARTPQVGVEFRPLKDLLFRAAYAEAFRAPQLSQLFTQQTQFVGQVTDTQRSGNPVYQATTVFGGSPDLQPETGKSHSFGVVWSSDTVSGLKASVDYWYLTEDNRIAVPSVPDLISFPDVYPGRVTRDPVTGLIQVVNVTYTNFGTLRASGFDLSLAYTFATPAGRFTPHVNWTLTTKYEAAVQPGLPLIDRLSRASDSDSWAPRNKATLGVNWHKEPYAASVNARYVGRYDDYQGIPNTNRLGGFALWDISGRVKLSRLMSMAYGKDVRLSASITNVFNKLPAYSNFATGNIGWDPTQYDILGRYIRVGLDVAW